MTALIVWIILIMIGAAIGQSRGRTLAGVLWSIPLGPIGWLIVILGPDLKAQAAADEAAIEQHRAARLQRQQLDTMRSLSTPYRQPRDAPRAPTPPAGTKWRVSKDGADLGEMDLAQLKLALKTGRLTLDDLYWDDTLADWIPLSTHESLS